MKQGGRRGKRGDSGCGWGQYPTVSLRVGGTDRTWLVHRLVALAFLGDPPDDGYQVNHKNGVRTDNRVENLEWLTQADNIRHAVATGLRASPVGEEHHNSRMSVDDVLAIKAAHKALIDELAARYGVTTTHVHNIIKGHRWAHLMPRCDGDN